MTHLPARVRYCAALIMPLVALTGCASSMNVSSYVERGVDVTRYHTYDWAPVDQLATGDPRLDNNPFFQERFQAAVEKGLATKGFVKATSATPEVLLHYHASVTQQLDVGGVDRESGYCDDCRPFVFDAGTMTLDLVDTQTNKLVWRGWAEGSIDGVVDDQEWMEQRIDEAVVRILERLPRRL